MALAVAVVRGKAFLTASLLILTVAWSASGHSEREVDFPDGDLRGVPAYRPFDDGHDHSHQVLVVCKQAGQGLLAADFSPAFAPHAGELLDLCADEGFEHIQAAVDAVTGPGANIYVLPGVYHEEPSRSTACGSPRGIISYANHFACPTAQALIGINGDDPADSGVFCGDGDPSIERLCDLQIEGVGHEAEDTVVEAGFSRLNAIRLDRVGGFYLKNMHFKETEFNAIYVLESDGVVLDNVTASNNWEYGILTFAVDSVLIDHCEAYANGDSGVYPGSASEYPGEGIRSADGLGPFSVEIRNCDLHDNALGYSGTAGNNVWVHHNKFYNNAAGLAMDSLFPGHPGLPQDSSLFEYNEIYSNNVNHYLNYGYYGKEDYCGRPVAERGIQNGTVCPVVPLPVGTGLLVAGGNNNTFRYNHVWDNHRYGMMLFTVPAPLRDEYDPALVVDTSHWNEFYGNVMGFDKSVNPTGDVTGPQDHNGLDFWWDEAGAGNCWQDNVASGGFVLSDPAVLPPCSLDDAGADAAYQVVRAQYKPPSPKLGTLVPCALFDKNDRTIFNPPVGCDWMNTPPEPTEVAGVRLPYLPYQAAAHNATGASGLNES